MKLNLKPALLVTLLFTPALMLGMNLETKRTAAEQSATTDTSALSDFAERKTQAAEVAQTESKSSQDKVDRKFVKTLLLIKQLPEELQHNICSFDKKLIPLNTIHGAYARVGPFRSLAVFQDNARWKVMIPNGQDGLKIWDIGNKEVLTTLPHNYQYVTAYEDNGPKALCSKSGHVFMLDLRSTAILKDIRTNLHWARILPYQDDNKHKAVSIASETCNIQIWDFTNDKCVRTLDGHTARTTCLALYKDEVSPKALTGSADQTICIWDLTKALPIHTLTGHMGSITSIAPYHDNTGWKAISSDENGHVFIWNLETRKAIKHFATQYSLFDIQVMQDDGVCTAVARTERARDLYHINLETGNITLSPLEHARNITMLNSYQDAGIQKFVTLALDETIRIWHHASEFKTIQAEQKAFHDAKEIIKLMPDNGTTAALQRLIYEYAQPESAAATSPQAQPTTQATS